MTLVRHTFRLTRYTLTVLMVLFGLVALGMWVQTLLQWGSAAAMADAMVWTVLTLVFLAFVVGLEHVENRGG